MLLSSLRRWWLLLLMQICLGQVCFGQDDPTVLPDEMPDDSVGDIQPADGEVEPEPEPPEEVRRSRPRTTQEELDYMARKAASDPFLQPFAPVGPAPGTQPFYNPLSRLRSASTLKPQVAKYLIQDRRGAIAGTLLLRIEPEQSARFGPMLHVTQRADSGRLETIELWQSTIGHRAVRVQRRRETASPDPSLPAATESFGVEYLFDRALIRKDSGMVTFARQYRMQPYSLDVAQLPLLMMLLDCEHADWPFEAVLFDCTSLSPVPLQVTKPTRADVLTAEPATYACWQLPLRFGNDSLTWFVERTGQHRLVKFEFSGYTFTLQQWAAGKA